MRWWWSAGNLDGALERLERMIANMPTRDDMDALKAEMKQAITDLAVRVAATIDALKNQLANGSPITQTDLDDLKADIEALKQVDPLAPPPPPPGP